MTPKADIKEGILAILDGDGNVKGTGFLITKNLAVTCAHVVLEASLEAGSAENDSIHARFANHVDILKASIVPECWRDIEDGDIAILKLETMPQDATPLRLGYAAQCSEGASFSSFGYAIVADVQGIIARGTIDGYLPQHKLLQLQAPQANHGISGAPVYDEKRDIVVGMITKGHTELGRNEQTTFATPCERIFELLPELKPKVAGINPFGMRGRVEDESAYFVRYPLVDEIFTELRKGQSLSILGDSQMGKSSLLWYIVHAGPKVLEKPQGDFIFMDLQLMRNDKDFYACLCEELGLPTLNGHALGRELRGRKVILCVDEVEKMGWKGFSHDLRSELRGLADGSSAPLTLVIASRSPLSRLFPDSPEMTSPLAGLCAQINLTAFTLQEAIALAQTRLAPLGLSLPQDSIVSAHQKSSGHPASLQEKLQQAFANRY